MCRFHTRQEGAGYLKGTRQMNLYLAVPELTNTSRDTLTLTHFHHNSHVYQESPHHLSIHMFRNNICNVLLTLSLACTGPSRVVLREATSDVSTSQHPADRHSHVRPRHSLWHTPSWTLDTSCPAITLSKQLHTLPWRERAWWRIADVRRPMCLRPGKASWMKAPRVDKSVPANNLLIVVT